MQTALYPAPLARAINRTIKRGWISRPDLATFVAHAKHLEPSPEEFMRNLVRAHVNQEETK